MGFLDKAKAKLTDAVDKHGDKIADGIDKAADSRTRRPRASTTTRSTGRRPRPAARSTSSTARTTTTWRGDARPDRPHAPVRRRPGVLRLPAARRRRRRRHRGAAAAAAEHRLHGRPLGRRGGRARRARRDGVRRRPARGGRGARRPRPRPGVRHVDAADPARRPDRRADRLLLHRAVVVGRAPRSSSRPSAPTCAGAGSTTLPDPVVPHERDALRGCGPGNVPAYTSLDSGRLSGQRDRPWTSSAICPNPRRAAGALPRRRRRARRRGEVRRHPGRATDPRPAHGPQPRDRRRGAGRAAGVRRAQDEPSSDGASEPEQEAPA